MEKYWPILLIVFSNVFYHICSKQTPEGINPFASLTVTYAVAAIVSAIIFAFSGGGSLIMEYKRLNWAPFIFGIAIVGLEVGSIYMYRVGWEINTGQVICSGLLAIALIFVGLILYREAVTWTKAIGITICLVGLYFINL